MSVVLVTGFGPFDDVVVNASGLLARAVGEAGITGHELHVEVLPTRFASRDVVKELVDRLRPAVVVSLGVSRDQVVNLERRASGIVTSQRPDVAGEVWCGRVLGPELRASGIDRWIVDLQAIDPTVALSDEAGGYVCDAIFHAALSCDVRAAFVHIPRDVDAVAARVPIIQALVAAMLV